MTRALSARDTLAVTVSGATGITAYLEHPDARVEVAQYLAGHARTETTRLHDRREKHVSLDEVERIGI